MIEYLDWGPSRKINYIYLDDISTMTSNLEVNFLAQNDTKYVFVIRIDLQNCEPHSDHQSTKEKWKVYFIVEWEKWVALFAASRHIWVH